MSEGNGPAFPMSGGGYLHLGMTLRDYFAAHAMNGMVASPELMQALTELEIAAKGADYVIAAYAYRYADAMLAERSK